MDLQSAIFALEKQSKEKGDLSDELAAKIRRREAEIKRLGGEIESLLFIVSNTKVTTTAPIEETPRTDETGIEVGGEPLYYFRDSNEWYNAAVYFDLVTRQGTMNFVARDEYTVTDYTGKDGISYFRIENANPYVTAAHGTNLFKKPVTLPKKPKLNLLAGLYGRSTDGREIYSVLYGRRFLKHGKVFVQGVYSDREVAGMAGLGLEF